MQRTLAAAAAAAMILLGGASAAAATGANLTGAESEPAAAATLGAGGPVDPAPAAAASGPPGPARTGQRDRKRISDHARNTIWAEYPAMQGAIDMINIGHPSLISYAIYPDQGYYDPRNIPTSTRKIPTSDMDTPHFWLLLKIWTTGYNSIFRGERSLDGSNGGIPTLSRETNPGVWHFARGLRTDTEENEADLLRALYIGATGRPDGAEPILTGSYMNMQSVQDTLREWENGNCGPFDGAKGCGTTEVRRYPLNAYLWNTLKNADVRDKGLMQLSWLALIQFRGEHRGERKYPFNPWIIGNYRPELNEVLEDRGEDGMFSPIPGDVKFRN